MKLQGPFLERIGRRGRGFSTFIVGPPSPTDRNNTQPVAAIQCGTIGLSLRALVQPFDYNKMPLAPMECTVQVHEKTDKRGTWAYHSID